MIQEVAGLVEDIAETYEVLSWGPGKRQAFALMPEIAKLATSGVSVAGAGQIGRACVLLGVVRCARKAFPQSNLEIRGSAWH